MSIGISSINSYSALNYQRLSSLLHTTTKAASSNINSLISNTLSSQDTTIAQRPDASDSLSMLQQLMGYINTNNVDPVFEIGRDTSMDKSGNLDSLFNITGPKNNLDSMGPLFDVSNPTGDIYSKLMNIQGLDSDDESSIPVYNSNFALLRALQKSGMKSEQITDVLTKVQNSTRYTSQGSFSSTPEFINGLYSVTA